MSSLPAPSPKRRGPVCTQGTVVKALNPHTAIIRLKNGHEALAHRPPDDGPSWPILETGALVHLEFSPCNMSHARILPQRD